MRRRRATGAWLSRLGVLLVAALLPACATPAGGGVPADAHTTLIDGGPYVPTPDVVVDEMLKLAEVGPGDSVYDLGSGDGRLVIEAARRGARGFGFEHNPELVERARAAAEEAGVAGRTRFVQGDLFQADLREATVVTLYLLPGMLLELAPKLRAELPPGARIVSHDFPLAGWQEERSRVFEVEEKAVNLGSGATQVFLYRIPAR